ncbi:hypothetical protein ACCO45_007524 [Purpureocillium lilacinum]|uniref:Uncharacterized protein n=1 Tax=Purpureocillium lilacinum TaxID=33203 RepID=A0ACC4DSP1_PURLI
MRPWLHPIPACQHPSRRPWQRLARLQRSLNLGPRDIARRPVQLSSVDTWSLFIIPTIGCVTAEPTASN